MDLQKIDNQIIDLLKHCKFITISKSSIERIIKSNLKYIINDNCIRLLYININSDNIVHSANPAIIFGNRFNSKYYPYIKKKFAIRYINSAALIDKNKFSINIDNNIEMLFSFYYGNYLIISDYKVYTINRIKYGL